MCVAHRVLAFILRMLQLHLHTGWVCTRAWHPGNLSCACHVRVCLHAMLLLEVFLSTMPQHCERRVGLAVHLPHVEKLTSVHICSCVSRERVCFLNCVLWLLLPLCSFLLHAVCFTAR